MLKVQEITATKMTEEDTGIDFSLEKKKKKKKKGFTADDDAAAPEVEQAPAPAPEPEPVVADVDDSLNFDGAKKKKKKAKALDLDLDAPAPEETTPAPAPAPAPVDQLADDLGEFSLEGAKKKKKAKAAAPLPDLDAPAVEAPAITGDDDLGEFNPESAKKKKKKKTAAAIAGDLDAAPEGGDDKKEEDSNIDYEYSELLARVFNIMRERNPDAVAGKKKHFVMKPPQVSRVSTTRTAFGNFAEICKLLHRPLDHVMGFLLAELGTSGSIDGSDALIFKGRFQQKMIENVLRAYIREYVTCHTCKSPDTILAKENRLFFLQCESCQSKCSVASIKAGFQAVTGKRSEIRKKEG